MQRRGEGGRGRGRKRERGTRRDREGERVNEDGGGESERGRRGVEEGMDGGSGGEGDEKIGHVKARRDQERSRCERVRLLRQPRACCAVRNAAASRTNSASYARTKPPPCENSPPP
eukprot:5573599-Pleurochrysis_carterae.AAC.1